MLWYYSAIPSVYEDLVLVESLSPAHRNRVQIYSCQQLDLCDLSGPRAVNWQPCMQIQRPFHSGVILDFGRKMDDLRWRSIWFKSSVHVGRAPLRPEMIMKRIIDRFWGIMDRFWWCYISKVIFRWWLSKAWIEEEGNANQNLYDIASLNRN